MGVLVGVLFVLGCFEREAHFGGSTKRPAIEVDDWMRCDLFDG